MLRRIGSFVIVMLVGGALLAAQDKTDTKKAEGIKGTVVKVDVKKKTITFKTEQGNKTVEVTDDTKFIGPRGGVSDDGINDDRLAKDNEIRVVIKANNRTAATVYLPYRKGEDKDKKPADQKDK
jgi:hypothetical protein